MTGETVLEGAVLRLGRPVQWIFGAYLNGRPEWVGSRRNGPLATAGLVLVVVSFAGAAVARLAGR